MGVKKKKASGWLMDGEYGSVYTCHYACFKSTETYCKVI